MSRRVAKRQYQLVSFEKICKIEKGVIKSILITKPALMEFGFVESDGLEHMKYDIPMLLIEEDQDDGQDPISLVLSSELGYVSFGLRTGFGDTVWLQFLTVDEIKPFLKHVMASSPNY